MLGVGLIGASFALSMRKNALCGHVAGCGRTEANLIRAKEMGIIDSFDTDPARACEDADLIVFATPVGTFKELANRIGPLLKQGAIVMDVGSVKGGLVYEMEDLMPSGVHFIGCHPIAGSNRSGIDTAGADLFRGALCIITETSKTDSSAFQRVVGVWRTFGSVIRTMEPGEHDRIYALVSHMPHLIAYALVNSVDDIDGSSLGFAGQGFKDSTRIASSSPEMWRDIVMLNRENLLKFIDAFKGNIDALCRHLRAGDASALEKEFRRAKKLREALKDNIGND
ncbi:MAG: prephenate dehydrogenase/arogenate dehydrogenase family protein [Thermodesulfovibrionales bacterium]|nr:prephenate dehydrogenase/arogenate dehydrogenase family protein [Thermodesulfovibrionales bacterium]